MIGKIVGKIILVILGSISTILIILFAAYLDLFPAKTGRQTFKTILMFSSIIGVLWLFAFLISKLVLQILEQGTVSCYAKADHEKVKSRPYDLLFPAPLQCGSGVQSARSKRINAHGTPLFPFHFPFQVSNDCSSNHSVYILHIFSEIVNTFYITYWK